MKTRLNKQIMQFFLVYSFVALISACSTNNDEPQSRSPQGAGRNNSGDGNPNPTYYPPSTQTPSTPVIPSTQVPTETDCYKASAFICKVERLITDKTNKYRASVGKPPLTHDPKMAFAARDWSAQQARYGQIGHDGFPELRADVYQKEFGTSRNFWAENVAMSGMSGGNGQTDADAERIAQDLASMWWNSSGHRANMVGNYKNIGVGMAYDGRGGWYGTQLFE